MAAYGHVNEFAEQALRKVEQPCRHASREKTHAKLRLTNSTARGERSRVNLWTDPWDAPLCKLTPATDAVQFDANADANPADTSRDSANRRSLDGTQKWRR